MWLGVLFIPAAESEEVDHDQAILVAFAPDRLLTTGSPVTMAPGLVRLLRQAGRETGELRPPRCGRCGEPLEVPPLEEWEAECASA